MQALPYVSPLHPHTGSYCWVHIRRSPFGGMTQGVASAPAGCLSNCGGASAGRSPAGAQPPIGSISAYSSVDIAISLLFMSISMAQSSPDWNPRFVERGSPWRGIFAPLQRRYSARLPPRWPDLAQLQALLGNRVTNAAGQALNVRVQTKKQSALRYEQAIFDHATLQVRLENWHDFFGLLMWRQWPLTRAALNAIQCQPLQASEGAGRGPRRDMATLLDETGVVLVVRDPAWRSLHRRHCWRSLFVERRPLWEQEIVPLVLGHGLLEQCRQPYTGLTAKAIYLPLPDRWFAMDDLRRQSAADAALATTLAQVQSPRDLLPLPVLGVPGWHEANTDPDFYNNTDYFRPRRQGS